MAAATGSEPGTRASSWPWLVSAALLLAAAVAASGAVRLFWLPCRGGILASNIFSRVETDLSDACLRRMDSGTPFPFPFEPVEGVRGAAELSAAAMAAAALAWLVLVLALRWPLRTRVVAAVPSVLMLVMSAQARWATVHPGSPGGTTSLAWWATADLAAVVVVATLFRWHPELDRSRHYLLLVVLSASTAFSLVHLTADYLVMSAWSTANWDVPPGTGTLTVVGLALAAALAALAPLLLRTSPPVRPVETVPLSPALH